MTRVKGQLVLTDPTEEVLVSLLFWMVAEPGEFDLNRVARGILDHLGEPTSHQVGPGLEAVTGDGRMARQVKLRWDGRLSTDGTENLGPYTLTRAVRLDRTLPSVN